VHLQTTVWPRK